MADLTCEEALAAQPRVQLGGAKKCKHLLNGAPDCVFCERDQLRTEVERLRQYEPLKGGISPREAISQLEIDQLRGELSLAEDGLAAYAQEFEQLKLTVTGHGVTMASPSKEIAMRKQFVQVETREQAETECPWAAEIIEVEGGFQCFESVQDAETFKGQE